MKTLIAAVLLTTSTLSPTLHAQSLAGAAKAEESRRTTIAKTAKVYTNQDVGERRPSDSGLPEPMGAAGVPPPAAVAPPRSAAVTALLTEIRSRCATEWATDFRMRAYCEGQQQEALTKLGGRVEAGIMNSQNGKIILGTCSLQWKTDYRMLEYCVEKQAQALEQLAR